MQKTIHTIKHTQLRVLLRTARRDAGLTQSQLAQRLDLPQSVVSNVERGERRLDLVELWDYCESMEIAARLREIAPRKEAEHNEKPLDSAAKVVKLLSRIEKVLLAEELTSAEKQKVLAGIVEMIVPVDVDVSIRLRSLTEQMILVIDNYDSFTYNLVQYFGELGAKLEVRRNDAITLAEIAQMAPEKIVLSPGPCTPNEAGITLDVIREFGPKTPILGVCLGHQAIGQALGGRVIRADRMMHGKTSPIKHNGQGVFHGLPSPLNATRYHSLIVERASLPDNLEITAETDEGEIMGLRHKSWPLEGVQFHPEAILTEHGKQMVRTFLER